MRTVGVLDAKTNLSALLEEIEQGGGPVIITRHGRPIARLTAAAGERVRKHSGAELLQMSRALREQQEAGELLSWAELKVIARNEDRY
ncbi:type II toxin-antitoxin system Phd/YefM family antitoxin [uncultured Brevundimonas sp.]|uniref:type II toxin-antitoxin system Phd/YefM family antitoxin n=1 Tax=uncultured Brevundimonas sp. TaxID=213418 RepID=UPI0030EEC18E|tara:strand:+ start:263 stop:526 length:264 start_codon:yes stop_codon:yes gene_type:complete